ncbi:MAG: hypothetical protein F6K18_07555 [Okeania sp. SIO2C2]|uniref:hypothetical protein n=1 Tax=Okeania sp. SIO2C2 TaxID=2607787 RepID=UPI0013BA63C7|nr:hypothetical protein [Okeania sp. SIO2C2]NEP86697.1 hypothetical protein [Okeania sp. SIO2C2]
MLKASQDDNISGTASRKIPKDERSPFSREIWLNKLNQIFISDFFCCAIRNKNFCLEKQIFISDLLLLRYTQ